MNRLLLRSFDDTALRRLLIAKGAMGESLTEYEAAGNPASFETNVAKPLKQMLIPFSPVQDLHGQANPYPAGGGVNILPPMVDGTYEENGVKAVVKDGVATFSGTTTSSGNAFMIPLASAFTVPSGTIYLHCLNSVANSSLNPAIENSQNTSQNINYGLSPANRITTGITGKEGQVYDRIRFYIGSGVSISGTYSPMICYDNTARSYAPYSNICPITGFSGVNVARTGTNLLDRNIEVYTTDNLYFGGDGTSLVPDGSLFLSAGTYTVSVSSSVSGIYVYNETGTRIAVKYNNTPLSFTIADRQKVLIRLSNSSTSKAQFDAMDIQLEIGSSASSFEEYSGTTIPVVFPNVSKNLLNPNMTGYGNYTIMGTGEYTPGNDRIATDYIPCEPNTAYTFSTKEKSGGSYYFAFAGIAGFDSNKNFVSRVYANNVTAVSYTTPSNVVYIRAFVQESSEGESVPCTPAVFAKYKQQLEKSTYETAYEPYTTTVYGGNLDVTTGVLTLTGKMRTASSLRWTQNAYSVNVFNGEGFTDRDPTIDGSAENGCLCSEYAWYTSANILNAGIEYGIALANNSGRTTPIFVKDIRYSSVSDFVSALAQNDVMIYVPLYEEKTFHLDPVTIQTLIGDNVIFSDTNGENTIKYLKKG